MKGYQDYHDFATDFESLIDALRWTDDLAKAGEIINMLSSMQEANQSFAILYLINIGEYDGDI